jgi:hypothetical protein
MALVNDKDRSLKSNIENHLVEDLTSKHISAISSMELYGPNAFLGNTEKVAIDKLNNTGIDGVLTIVLLDKTKERYYVPGRVYYSPYGIYHRRFWGYYSTLYERVYEPGYYSENTNYFWESNFYDLQNKELLYSVQTKSFNPGDAASLGHEYGKMICESLLKTGIIR